MITAPRSEHEPGLSLVVNRREVLNVFVGCATLAEGMEERYTAIRNECWAMGMRTHRSYALPSEPTIRADGRQRLADADAFIFDLSDASESVPAELDAALALERPAHRLLLITKAGERPPQLAALGKVRSYSSLEDLRGLTREWAAHCRAAAWPQNA